MLNLLLHWIIYNKKKLLEKKDVDQNMQLSIHSTWNLYKWYISYKWEKNPETALYYSISPKIFFYLGVCYTAIVGLSYHINSVWNIILHTYLGTYFQQEILPNPKLQRDHRLKYSFVPFVNSVLGCIGGKIGMLASGDKFTFLQCKTLRRIRNLTLWFACF